MASCSFDILHPLMEGTATMSILAQRGTEE